MCVVCGVSVRVSMFSNDSCIWLDNDSSVCCLWGGRACVHVQ